MAKMHLRHSRKGHTKPDFSHPLTAREDSESVIASVTRTRPLPEVKPTKPANGHYSILNDEQALRRAYAADRDILPWPTKPEKGLYSRLLMEKDLEAISQYEAGLVHLIATNQFQGHSSLRAFKICDEMRANCKAALMRTVSILQAKEQEEKAKQALNPITINGIRLTPAQSEHIRRLATDKDYLLREVKNRERLSLQR